MKRKRDGEVKRERDYVVWLLVLSLSVSSSLYSSTHARRDAERAAPYFSGPPTATSSANTGASTAVMTRQTPLVLQNAHQNQVYGSTERIALELSTVPNWNGGSASTSFRPIPRPSGPLDSRERSDTVELGVENAAYDRSPGSGSMEMLTVKAEHQPYSLKER